MDSGAAASSAAAAAGVGAAAPLASARRSVQASVRRYLLKASSVSFSSFSFNFASVGAAFVRDH